MSYEPVDFFVKDTTPLKNPLAGVMVKILSLDGATTYGMQQTDSFGQASFLLPTEFPYQARFYRFGVSFKQPQLFSVLPSPLAPGTSNIFDIPATIVTAPVPNDLRLCTAYGFFRDITGAAQPGVEIMFIAKFQPLWLDGAAVVKERVSVVTDDRGYVEVTLIRNGQYNVTLTGEEDVVRTVNVPDQPNVNISDLIFPIVQRVVTVPAGPFVLQKGEELEVELHIYSSDGNDMGPAIGDVYYRSSDGEVVGYGFTSTSIVLKGEKVGTGYVSLTRADQSIVHIPDSGILGQPLLVTVIP